MEIVTNRNLADEKKQTAKPLRVKLISQKDGVGAHDTGVTKAAFAKDNRMTVKDLDRILDRVSKRKKPSE